ncbi:helix-turn-helix domain-containing protein [Streptomyces sp. JW3]|uniref:AraC-like ligand-binding domain-containing protein n=1 Tax=Streptomyces sp. JW3 TaxID=3456955 RepID=UPI003FA49682
MSDKASASSAALFSMSSDDLPQADRFDWYTRLSRQEIAHLTLTSAHARDFRARASVADLGGTQIGRFSFSPLRALRSPAHIRHHDPETYFLGLIQGSTLQLSHCRNETGLSTGEMVLFDSCHPFDAGAPEHGDPVQVIMMRLPKRALPLPEAKADRLLGHRLSARTGSAALLASYLTGLEVRAAECAPAELARLGSVMVDLAAAHLAHLLDAQHLLTVETRQRALLERVKRFIDLNLADPDLEPRSIAAHHHVSVRTLHALFRDQQHTVAATIRRRRLERCRADLLDARLRRVPIGAIAARWGFLRPADFSRAFRAAYGITPRDARGAPER